MLDWQTARCFDCSAWKENICMACMRYYTSIGENECPLGITAEDVKREQELTAEQKKAVKKMTYSDTHEVKKRFRPIDERKLTLMDYLDEVLYDFDAKNIVFTVEGREMEFDFEGGHFRLTLAMPRKERK